uniref:Uncharacterized protein n=1 Tax=Brassica oleracea var. oleracea TaxID=109376 RepID=A0A0D2ZSA2_BRAOL
MTFALRQLVLLKQETSWLHTLKFFLVTLLLGISILVEHRRVTSQSDLPKSPPARATSQSNQLKSLAF